VILAAVVVSILFSFPSWHKEWDERGEERDVKPFPSRTAVIISFTASLLAAIFALVATIWQYTASVAGATTAQDMAYGTVNSEVGAAATGLGWTGVGLTMVPAIGIVWLLWSLGNIADLRKVLRHLCAWACQECHLGCGCPAAL